MLATGSTRAPSQRILQDLCCEEVHNTVKQRSSFVRRGRRGASRATGPDRRPAAVRFAPPLGMRMRCNATRLLQRRSQAFCCLSRKKITFTMRQYRCGSFSGILEVNTQHEQLSLSRRTNFSIRAFATNAWGGLTIVVRAGAAQYGHPTDAVGR
jgi:hypothetical protein